MFYVDQDKNWLMVHIYACQIFIQVEQYIPISNNIEQNRGDHKTYIVDAKVHTTLYSSSLCINTQAKGGGRGGGSGGHDNVFKGLFHEIGFV